MIRALKRASGNQLCKLIAHRFKGINKLKHIRYTHTSVINIVHTRYVVSSCLEYFVSLLLSAVINVLWMSEKIVGPVTVENKSHWNGKQMYYVKLTVIQGKLCRKYIKVYIFSIIFQHLVAIIISLCYFNSILFCNFYIRWVCNYFPLSR